MNYAYTREQLVRDDCEIGEFTYGVPSVRSWGEGARLRIGRYCSIADQVEIFLGGDHHLEWVSTYPFACFDLDWPGSVGPVVPMTKGDVIIGSDVWIGSGVLILSGVTIGHGAVLAARSVVTRDVPPYGVVAGNPARLIKKRFEDETIARLLAVAWWDWPYERVLEYVDLLSTGAIEQFLERAAAACEDPTDSA